jgi:hypothetical protein
MKKQLLILAFSFISLMTFCQNKITPTLVFETGHESRQDIIYLSDEMRFVEGIFPLYKVNAFYSYINVSASYKGFELYTSNKCFFDRESKRDYTFTPLLQEYKVGASYTRKAFTLGAEHFCSHNVETLLFHEDYDRFYLRVTLKFNK